MASQIFRLGKSDFIKGAVTAVLGAVAYVLYSLTIKDGFDIATVDWSALSNATINAAVASFFGYIAKNFVSDSDGKILGKIG